MREAIYKGATRPALLFGVPLVPAVLVGGLGTLLVSYALVITRNPFAALAVLVPVVILWIAMLAVTRKDDQRLMQHLLRLRLRQSPVSRRVWKSISYAPGAVRSMRDRPQP
jgi:type IV secretion system protein VirB3